MRALIHTDEFEEFYEGLPVKVQKKFDFCLDLLETLNVVSTKLVKKIVSSQLYELRVSVDNEYRVLLFAVDNDSLVLATRVILLNGFIKKSNKDYPPAVRKAEQILSNIEL